jgi:hypothetical protein
MNGTCDDFALMVAYNSSVAHLRPIHMHTKNHYCVCFLNNHPVFFPRGFQTCADGGPQSLIRLKVVTRAFERFIN